MKRTAGLHRRRLHRRHRPCRHAGQGRHAHGADDRRARQARCPDDVDAVVIALKSRTNPVGRGRRRIARGAALAAGRPAAGSSTSSTARPSTPRPRGNIGPVAEALMEALGTDFTIACPAFPANGRTIYKGHLFVGDAAAVRFGHAPPSADADDRRQPGARAAAAGEGQGRSGRAATVAQGAAAIARPLRGAAREGCNFAVVDALSDDDLHGDRRCLRRPAAGDRRFRHRPGPAAELPPAGLLADTEVAAALPADRRPARGHLGQLLDRDARTGGGDAAARHPAFNVDPLRSRARRATSWAKR